MQSVRDAAEGIEKRRSRALKDIPVLEDELKCALILGGIRNCINAMEGVDAQVWYQVANAAFARVL